MVPSLGAPYPGAVDEPRANDDAPAVTFRLGFVPGATPAKWARVFRARHPEVALGLVPVTAAEAERAVIDGDLDAAILRPPVDRAVLHAVLLYDEEPVVVVPKDHLLAALEESETVDPADLTDEVLLQPADDVLRWAGSPDAPDDAIALPGRPPVQVPATTELAIQHVATGLGVLVLPRSLARLHHRKDLTVRRLANGPRAPVALAWSIEREDELTEDLVGIVRGRTVNSSRGAAPARAEEPSSKRGRGPGPRRRRATSRGRRRR